MTYTNTFIVFNNKENEIKQVLPSIELARKYIDEQIALYGMEILEDLSIAQEIYK